MNGYELYPYIGYIVFVDEGSQPSQQFAELETEPLESPGFFEDTKLVFGAIIIIFIIILINK